MKGCGCRKTQRAHSKDYARYKSWKKSGTEDIFQEAFKAENEKDCQSWSELEWMKKLKQTVGYIYIYIIKARQYTSYRKTRQADNEICRLSMPGLPRKTEIKWNFFAYIEYAHKTEVKELMGKWVLVVWGYGAIQGARHDDRFSLGMQARQIFTIIWKGFECLCRLFDGWCPSIMWLTLRIAKNFAILSVCPQRRKLKRARTAPKPR